jgi:hypothetical protein
MRSIAEMLQRNPSLVLVLLVGLPSLTWSAAYARRPSRGRRRIALGALAVTLAVAMLATVEAARAGAAWWPPLALAALVAAICALLVRRRR